MKHFNTFAGCLLAHKSPHDSAAASVFSGITRYRSMRGAILNVDGGWLAR